MTNEEIATKVAEYDYRRSLGIAHDARYDTLIRTYRIALNLPEN